MDHLRRRGAHGLRATPSRSATPGDIFREHAALSAFENEGARDFDIGALAAVTDAAYDALAPVQWPQRAGEEAPETRFFAQGGFFTPDRKGRFVATPLPVRAPRHGTFPG